MKKHFLWVLLFSCITSSGFASSGVFEHLSSHERHELIRHAQIWTPSPVSSKDLFTGPRGNAGFKFNEVVHCRYVQKRQRGTSPKFFCRLDSGEVVKVRYGRANEEVYAQVATSRLLWALGFGANENYPVRVICDECSMDPWNDPEPSDETVTFNPAIIERKVGGEEITEENKSHQGWGWNELALIDEERGGATKAQIDALKLLAVFIAHVDSRPDNQRMVCLEGGIIEDEGKKRCTKPFMYLSDVGTTFGGEHEVLDYTTLKLKVWESWPVWKDPARCIADLLPEEQTPGMLRSPRISEPGRKLLADLLIQLTDRQIADLFRVAKVDQVLQLPGYASVEDWVNAFKRRRAQIVDHRCPQ